MNDQCPPTCLTDIHNNFSNYQLIRLSKPNSNFRTACSHEKRLSRHRSNALWGGYRWNGTLYSLVWSNVGTTVYRV